MSTTATSLLNVCRSQIGYREGSNNDNKYGIWYGWNHVPYCAIGLAWAGAQCGATDILQGRYAYCPAWVGAWKAAGRWEPYGSTPQRGDIAFFDWTGNHGTHGHEAQHVGIVEDNDSGVLVTIEFNTVGAPGGNQSDGEGVWRRRRSQLYVVGYGRPSYAPETGVTPLPGDRIPLVIDGVWGPKTTTSLQAWLTVTADGVIGPVTRRALQARLNVTVDGDWGPRTHRALQQLLAVTSDGQWGPITVKALQRHLNRAVGRAS